MTFTSSLRRSLTGAAVLSGIVALGASSASAQNFFGLTSNSQLIQFNPGVSGGNITPISTTAITGITTGQSLIGLDFRPADGLLYTVGASGLGTANITANIYTINTTTGAATNVAPITFTTGGPISGSQFGFDFNPMNNLLRLTSDTGQSLAVNPTTGVIAAPQPAINGATTSATAAGYTNNFNGTASTTLFVINTDTDQLFTQVAATSTTTLVGNLGVNIGANADLDIVTLNGTNTAYLAGTIAGANNSSFFGLNLTNGSTNSLGTFNIAGGGFVTDVAVQVAAPEPGSIALIGTGLLSVAGMVVRRRRAA